MWVLLVLLFAAIFVQSSRGFVPTRNHANEMRSSHFFILPETKTVHGRHSHLPCNARKKGQGKPFASSGRPNQNTAATPDMKGDTINSNDEAVSMTNFHFFWRSESPFSQWHKASYVLDGVEYVCAEQGMMHGKALLFRDHDVAKLILQTSNPKEMKVLGRKIKVLMARYGTNRNGRLSTETQWPSLRKTNLCAKHSWTRNLVVSSWKPLPTTESGVLA